MFNCNLCTGFDCSFCKYYKLQVGAIIESDSHDFQECDFCVSEVKRRKDPKQELNARSGMTEKLLKSCELIRDVIENLSDRQLVAELEAIVRGLKCVIEPLKSESITTTIIGTTRSLPVLRVESRLGSFNEGKEIRPNNQKDQAQFATPGSDLLKTHHGKDGHKNGDGPSFQCPSCPSMFYHRKTLKSHLRTHGGAEAVLLKFKCKICPFSTEYRSSLKAHEWRHTGQKPYGCQLCPYRTMTKYGLLEHNRRHMGEKPFSCGQCPYRCTTSGDLIKHNQRKHTGEKPYKCPICSYSAVSAGELTRHERRHFGASVKSKAVPYRVLQEHELNVTSGGA